MVPHLVTALNGPLLELERKILDATPAIERWFRLEWQEHTPPFYCSVDLRNAGFKLAPVDANLFPGNFNNLPPEVLPLAVQAAMAAIEKICPDAKGLLVIPELPTRNAFYLENVARLATIMRQAGLNVRFGSLDPSVTDVTPIALADGKKIVLEPLERSQRRLGLKNFDPCSILLNNDLSGGIPDVLENLHEQYLLPPLHAGWTVRRKSTHFACYDDVAKKFAKMVGVDPWMVNPYFAHVGGIDWQAGNGGEALADAIDAVLKKITRKYREYDISEKPYVVVKADAGTAGRGVMTVHDASEIGGMTQLERAQMSETKAGLSVSDVIVQEGVHTFERIGDDVAEPVVYMIDRYVVGSFYRTHAARERDQNLNAPGMHYVPLGFEHTALPDAHAKPSATPPNRFYMYGVVGRLGLLASSIELEKTDPEAFQV
ncbi:MAG: glutamate--cysteine ligase [Burkholderia sp.]